MRNTWATFNSLNLSTSTRKKISNKFNFYTSIVNSHDISENMISIENLEPEMSISTDTIILTRYLLLIPFHYVRYKWKTELSVLRSGKSHKHDDNRQSRNKFIEL